MQEVSAQLKKVIQDLYGLDFDPELTPSPANIDADYSTNAPLKLAKLLHKSPMEISEKLRETLISNKGVFRSAAARELAREPRGDGSERRGLGKNDSYPLYQVALSEGRNRQIRRTFAALGYRVTMLHRTQFGKYELSGLKPGKYVIIKP